MVCDTLLEQKTQNNEKVIFLQNLWNCTTSPRIMKTRVDFRLVLLLFIAAAFLQSSLQLAHAPAKVIQIQQDTLDFNYNEIFDVPEVRIFEEYCSEESSPPCPMPAL